MTVQLDNKNHLINSYTCCSRNPFIEYGDIETDMEKLGPDDDWDSERIPQYTEIHAVTKYEHIYKMFDIPLHYKAQSDIALSEEEEKNNDGIRNILKSGIKCEAIIMKGSMTGQMCNKIYCLFPSHKSIIKQLIDNYLLKFYENKLLTEEQCKPLCDYAPKNIRISFAQYVINAKYKCSLTKKEQEENRKSITKCHYCRQMLTMKMRHTQRFQSGVLIN